MEKNRWKIALSERVFVYIHLKIDDVEYRYTKALYIY